MAEYKLFDRVDVSKNRQKPRYAFFIHPRDTKDVIYNYPDLQNASEKEIEETVLNAGPCVLGEIRSNNDTNYGIVIGLPIIPTTDRRRFLRGAREKVKRGVSYAHELGCQYVGFGGLLSAIANYGEDVLGIDGITPTTGHTLSTWAMLKGLEKVTREFDLQTPKIAVVGALGSVGRLLSKSIQGRPYEIILIDVEEKKPLLYRFSEFLKDLYPYTLVNPSTDLYNLNQADIIVTVTNAPKTLINIEDITPGKVLLDDAQPWCWDRNQLLTRFKQNKDVLGLDGGIVRMNDDKYCVDVEMGVGDNQLFSCLGELILLCKHPQRLQPTIGIASISNCDGDLERLRTYDEIAKTESLDIVPWLCNDYQFTQKDLSEFRTALARK